VVPVQSTPRKQSTFLERFGFAALLGGLTALAATELAGDDYDVAAGFTGLALGSAGGVILVGAKREGAEPIGALVGAGLGAGAAGAVVAAGGELTFFWPITIAVLLLPPIGAAIGHEIACDTCRRPGGRGPPL